MRKFCNSRANFKMGFIVDSIRLSGFRSSLVSEPWEAEGPTNSVLFVDLEGGRLVTRQLGVG
jgi:hypothetical protein